LPEPQNARIENAELFAEDFDSRQRSSEAVATFGLTIPTPRVRSRPFLQPDTMGLSPKNKKDEKRCHLPVLLVCSFVPGLH